MLISVILGIVVPKVIGPNMFGVYSYLTSTYIFLFQFCLLSSNTAYIYMLSKGKHDIGLINSFYFIFLSIISFLILVFSLFTFNFELLISYIWNNISNINYLTLALFFGVVFQIQQRLIDFSDSTSQTFKSEKYRLISKAFVLISILVFINFLKFNIKVYFLLNIISVLVFLVLFFKNVSFKLSKLNFKKLKLILNEFIVYLRPLIIFSLVASIYSYLGKYLLQSSTGSIEQGYYNFAYQLVMIPVGLIYSIMTILFSEMTKTSEQKNINHIKSIYLKSFNYLYVLHAIFTSFLIINANKIVNILVGESFVGAVPCLKFLAIFSLLNTIAMTSSNVFFSKNKNKLYSIINTTVMSLGLCFYIYLLVGSYTIDSILISKVVLVFYSIRVSIQLIYTLNFLQIKKFIFLINLFVIFMVVYLLAFITKLLDVHIIFNLLLMLTSLLLINFLANDYINLKIIYFKFINLLEKKK